MDAATLDHLTDKITRLTVQCDQLQGGLNRFAAGVGEAIGFEVREGVTTDAILEALKQKLGDREDGKEPTPLVKAKA